MSATIKAISYYLPEKKFTNSDFGEIFPGSLSNANLEKLGITLLPVDQGWFALVGEKRGWTSPAEFIAYLQTADFANSDAAVGDQAPLTICLAVMKALERRQVGACAMDRSGSYGER